MVFYGLFYATYLGPYYSRLVTVYEYPVLHVNAARLFWTEVLQIVSHIGCGLMIVAKAEKIIDALRPSGEELGYRSLAIVMVKLNGFLLLFNAGISTLRLLVACVNSGLSGWSALVLNGPLMFRTCLYLFAGFITVSCAERIIGALLPRETGRGAA